MVEGNIPTALVTGASSGLGFETAAQLVTQGTRVIVTARTADKAAATRDRLGALTGSDDIEVLVLDNDDLATVEAAAQTLATRGGRIDLLVLNAGIAPPSSVTRSVDGIEGTVAATLVGHHLLTMRLLEHDLLGDHARIVIAGSEAARGDVPTFHPVDLSSFASEHFSGDLEPAIEAQFLMEPPAEYKASDVYATAKMFVAWWAARLAHELPAGMTVNAVSPGSTPETNAARNAPFYMRKLMIPMFKLMPGMSHSVADGAARYLEVADYDDDVSGKFFASPPKKMIGPLVEVDLDHLNDLAGQQALWNVTTKVAGGVGYPATS